MSTSASRPDTEVGDLLVANYERLRGNVLDQGIHIGTELGLGVLMSRGMRAWMQLCSSARVAPLPPRKAVPRDLLLDATRGELVGVLVGMALGGSAWRTKS